MILTHIYVNNASRKGNIKVIVSVYFLTMLDGLKFTVVVEITNI